LLIGALAYFYARRHARNPRVTFGTGKLGDLAGFASAIILSPIALLVGWEYLLRLANPILINLGQAVIMVARGFLGTGPRGGLLKGKSRLRCQKLRWEPVQAHQR
jgi:Co/Zn/Cd efflux system component